MAEVPSGPPRGDERPNPSVESTRRDEELIRRQHEDAAGTGAAVGTGLGCLGLTIAPLVMIAFGIAAAVAIAIAIKGCGGQG
jgi:hypothetical protein